MDSLLRIHPHHK